MAAARDAALRASDRRAWRPGPTRPQSALLVRGNRVVARRPITAGGGAAAAIGGSGMRTGADYREALRDGRRVWVMGEGWAEDVTTHPATRAMVDEYALWYDRHLDPAWQRGRAVAVRGRCGSGCRGPMSRRKKSMIWSGMGRSFAKTTFLSAGNVTHTPAYGNLIALGVLTAAQSGERAARADRRRRGLSRRHRPHRAVFDLLRRRPDHRPAHAPGPGRAGRA